MNLNQIKDAIATQARDWEAVSPLDYQSNQSFKEAIENEFLSENDITSRSHEFDDDADYVEVCALRADAMHNVLLKHGVLNADDFEDATENLEFSHVCGGSSSNNIHLVAYKVDNDNYRIFRFSTDEYGNRLAGIHSHDMLVTDYDELGGHDFESLERFYAVNSLFAPL